MSASNDFGWPLTLTSEWKVIRLMFADAKQAGFGMMFPKFERKDMYALFEEVMSLALAFGGSTSGANTIGLIRTRYVERQFGPELYQLFEHTKDIFDPQGIFNPGKKVRGDWAYAQAHVKQ